MNEASEKFYDVVIVGGGPVGLGLAIELGQRGIQVAVVEKYEKLHRVPKGQNLTQRTMEHFSSWGIEKELRAVRTNPVDSGIGGLTAYGTLLGDYKYDWFRRSWVDQYYNCANERLPQYATEGVLRQRASELENVTLVYGWSAIDVEQDSDSATVTIQERNGEAQRTIRGQYLVGCDGSRSVIREKSGLTQTVAEHDKSMVLLVFKAPELDGMLGEYKSKSFFNVLNPEYEGYWQFFGRVDANSTWFFHAPVPHGTTRDNFDFKGYLQESVGAELDIEFDYIGFWDLRVSLADNYRSGRIFIAGDAAHSHPPYGGYGINTGFEDVRNLGWKLAATLKGWGGNTLLDAYSEERHPVFASTARDFIVKSIETDGAFLANHDPEKDRKAFEAEWDRRGSAAPAEVGAFEPNYDGSSLVSGTPGARPGAKGSHRFKARGGHHIAPVTLTSGRSVFTEFGPGFTLLAFGADETDVAAFEAAAADRQLPLTVVRDDQSGARAQYEAKLVLLRPDHFIAWAGDSAPDNASHILMKSTGHPVQ